MTQASFFLFFLFHIVLEGKGRNNALLFVHGMHVACRVGLSHYTHILIAVCFTRQSEIL